MKIKSILQNNKALILIFLISFALIYKLSLIKSWNLYQDISILKKEINKDLITLGRLKQIKEKKVAYDSILKGLEIDNNLNLSNYIFEKIQSICDNNKVKISSYQKPHQIKISEKHIQTSYIFKLNGHFKNTLKSVNEIEIQSLGSIVHLKFEKIKNYKTNKNELYCDVILQVID